MFDERHLQLTSAYAKSSQYFARAVIAPYLKLVLDSIELVIDDEINKRLKLEIGKETYVMNSDGNGGWKWEKFDPKTNEFIQAEFAEQQEFEELLTELLTPLLPYFGDDPFLPPSDISPLLPPSTTPPDLPPSDSPPVLPPDDKPPFLPPSATPVELVVIPVEVTLSEERVHRENHTSQKQNNFKEAESEDKLVQWDLSSELGFEYPSASNSPSDLIPPIPIYKIDPNHLQEFVKGSAIAPLVASLNFKSLHNDPIEQEHEAWEHLMYSDKLERLNTGRLSTGMLNRYSHLDAGGWWCDAGVDPRDFALLEPGDKPTAKIWGCYKPNNPREKADNPGKFIKYEHPPKVDLSIFLLDVPDDIAERIYEKAGVQPTESDRTSGFWYCVWKHNLPVTIIEGAKKAASLLSQSEAAIGLPGIYAGYRSKDELGNQRESVLHDELAVFATKNRDIKICFDYETRLKTQRNINIATYRTGQLLEVYGAKVSVISLPGPEKGVDDLIVAQGAEAFRQVSETSVPLDDWWQKNQPPDLRLTIFLKNGEQIRLYEQKGDGTVNVTLENLSEEQTISVFAKNHSKLSIRELTDLITISENSTPNSASQVIDAEVLADEPKKEVAPSQSAPPLSPVEDYPIDSWARREQVTVYQQNFFRKRLEARENKEIASTALALVKNYGVQQDDNLVYRADAFTINKVGNNYSIHRRTDESKALIQFHADKWGAITLSEQPKDILPIERQEFLLVADYLKSGKQLPSVDEDPRKIASTLGSLSLHGTHEILESFKQAEVLQILTQTLKKAGRDDLKLGNYRILYEKSRQDSTSVLQLLKTEHNGITRVSASFELNRTDSGMTHQLKTLAITEVDLSKLRLLAQKLHIPQSPVATATVNSHATRDIELPLHPKLTKQWQDLENRTQHQNSVSFSSVSDPFSNSQVERPIKKTSNFQAKPNLESIPLPLHPLLGQYWQELENTDRWSNIAKQENSEFREKLKQTGKLTIGEQRELYNKILLHSLVEQRHYGTTDISLPQLSEILQDLMSTRSEAIDNTYSPKVEVRLEKRQQPHQNSKSASGEPEVEL